MRKSITTPVYSAKNFDWTATIFLLSTPIFAAIFLPFYFYFWDLSWPIITIAILHVFFSNFCITAGYHRLYAHRSYQARAPLQLFLLFFGAGTFQATALKWCTDHRRHHKEVDGNDDPYSIAKGSFYAHFGWMLMKEETVYRNKYESDLLSNKLVAWQARHYLALAIGAGFLVPTIVGWALGDAIGGFLFIGLVRIIVGHHTTFLVNSLCHIWGRQPYTIDNSAKDNLLVAILTNGEGYHNFHHCFEGDYRNGVRWYQWDPTKWAINIFSWFGQTYKLRRVSHAAILKSRLETDKRLLEVRGLDVDHLAQLKKNIETLIKKTDALKADYVRVKREFKADYVRAKREFKADYARVKHEFDASSKEKMLAAKTELALARHELKLRLSQWRGYVAMYRRQMYRQAALLS